MKNKMLKKILLVAMTLVAVATLLCMTVAAEETAAPVDTTVAPVETTVAF